MSTETVSRERLLNFRSEQWNLESVDQIENTPANLNNRSVKARLNYQGGIGDTARRTTLYFLGFIPVFVGSLACGALCCYCSSQASKVQHGHVKLNEQNPKEVKAVYHDHETAEGIGEISSATENAAWEALTWNKQFFTYMAPFQSKTHVKEVVATREDLRAVFDKQDQYALLQQV